MTAASAAAPARPRVEIGRRVQPVPFVGGRGVEHLAVQPRVRIAQPALLALRLAEVAAQHLHAALLRVHVLQQRIQPPPIRDSAGLEHRRGLVDLLARGFRFDALPARRLDLLRHAHRLQHRQDDAYAPFWQRHRQREIADRNFLALIAPRVEALGDHARLRLGRVRLLEEVFLDGQVVGLVQQHAARWLAIASGASRLLHVRLGRPGHLVMDDVADVGLVDAQPERVGRQHDDLAARLHERRLRLLALVARHLAVVALDRNLAVPEGDIQFVDRAYRRAVDDAGPAQPLDQLAELAEFVRLTGDLAYVEREVRPVERHAADLRVLHPELDQHVVRDRGRGRRGQPEDRRPPQYLRRAPQPQVRRAEVVAPLRHAVRLVHTEQGELHARQRFLNGWRVHGLRRDHHQLDAALADGGEIGGAFLRGARRIDAHDRHARRLELVVLILDQREQRRDDQRRPIHHQRG